MKEEKEESQQRRLEGRQQRVAISSGGRLPFSPTSFLGSPPSISSREKKRKLDSQDNDDEYSSSYLVDKDGNAYEPYALAWRYLGMYLDCDLDDNVNDVVNEDGERYLANGSGDGDCERVLLWAAYVDPRYRGGSIGEYQYFDIETNTWDKSSCRTRRCARMNCHEPNSHFKLVGVFKETDGLEDWAEQLFKHEGYCLWDSDVYEAMQDRREKWPTYCIQLYYTIDADGNSLYTHLKPAREGNITMGIYLDDKCTQESSLTFFDYVIAYYNYYYGDQDEGEQAAASWNASIATWNTYMNTYKICQPCRAYNIGAVNDDKDDSENDSEDEKQRFLDNSDGEGEEEQWGFNCYDDAGYTNCNQCYKFETKTDLETAYAEDLARASKQETILEIVVDGKTYGSGGYRSSFPDLPLVALVVVFSVLVCGITFLAYLTVKKCAEISEPFRSRLLHGKPKETTDSDEGGYSDSTSTSHWSSSTMSGFYSEFSDFSINGSGLPWSCCAPIESLHGSMDSQSLYTGHSLSSTSQDFSSDQDLDSSSCDSVADRRRRKGSIKWIEFRNSLLTCSTNDSEESRFGVLRRRILFPEESRWIDLRNKILGSSRSSWLDHNESDLSSSFEQSFSEKSQDDIVDGIMTSEQGQVPSAVAGIGNEETRDEVAAEAVATCITERQLQNQEDEQRSTGAPSTTDESGLFTINEGNDSIVSSSDDDRFEILQRRLLSTSTDLVDDRWVMIQREILEFNSHDLLPGDSDETFHTASEDESRSRET